MEKTLIIGKSAATADQMAAYLLSVNPTPQVSMAVTDFCQLYLDVAAREGVRGDALFAQSCKETGNFNFRGTVKAGQNNFAGLGTTDTSTPGASFPDAATGILAQAQHAKAYATASGLSCPCADPRYSLLKKYGKLGTAPHWEDLGGKWAVPGYDTAKYASLEAADAAEDSYGYQIIKILDKILDWREKDMPYTNSALVSYTKISPNKNTPRNHAIDTITIHHMAGNLSVETCGNLFASPARQGSSNYGIGSDGRIALYVEEKDRSWCSSSKENDHRAVTIEVANDGGAGWHVSDKALASLIALVADICRRNAIKKLVWSNDKNNRINHKNGCNMTVHRDFAATSCPGDYLYGKQAYIAEEVNKRLTDVPAANQGTVGVADTVGSYKVGDIVSFAGSKQYTSANAASGSACKPGPAKITAISAGAKHPYHIIHTDSASNVYGWVDAADIGSAALSNRTYTVKSGDSLWTIAVKQLGDGNRYKEIKSLNCLPSDTIRAGQILRLPN